MNRILGSGPVFCLGFLTGVLLLCGGLPPPGNHVANVRYQLVLRNILYPLLSAASTQAYQYERVNGGASARKRYFFVGKFNPDVYPDTLTVFRDGPASKYTSSADPAGKYIVRKMGQGYYGSFGNLETYLHSMWGISAVGPALAAKFQQEFGVSPVTAYVPTADGRQWPQWSGEAVLLAFNRYYGPPATSFQHTTYQALYNLAARDYAARYVALLNHLLVTMRTRWNQLCSQYALEDRRNPKFEGATASSQAVRQLFTSAELARFPAMQAYMYVPVGQLMRRQCDGSLPAVVQCVARVLAAYDPATRQQLHSSLTALR